MKKRGFVEVLAWIVMAAAFAVAAYGMKTLPDQIAVHYDVNGQVDEYGSPASLFILPAIMLFCLALISFVAHFVKPQHWNMPFEVREANSDIVYGDIRLMMYLIELETSVFTLWATVREFGQTVKGMGIAVAVYMAIMAATIVLLCIKAKADNNSEEI